MKSILFVHYEFELGGICNSLLSFLTALGDKSDLSISLLILNGDTRRKDSLPGNCKLIQTPRIIRCMFSDKTTILRSRNIINILMYLITRAFSRLFGMENAAKFFSKIGRIRKRYDIAVSFANDIYDENGKCLKCGCNQYVAEGVDADKKIAWIHAFVEQIGYKDNIAKETYKKFDKIVNCNNTCKDRCNQLLPSLRERTVTVNNVINEKRIAELANILIDLNPQMFNIVTVARIDNHTKRIDRIPLVVEELIRRKRRRFLWHIIGDGRDLASIKETIQQKNLSNYITLHGSMQNPYPYIKNSNVYVQTSDFEAMPMVILEAEFLKTPIISTPYPAANEMINDGIGLVTSKGINDIASAIELIMDKKASFDWKQYVQPGIQQLNELLGCE